MSVRAGHLGWKEWLVFVLVLGGSLAYLRMAVAARSAEQRDSGREALSIAARARSELEAVYWASGQLGRAVAREAELRAGAADLAALHPALEAVTLVENGSMRTIYSRGGGGALEDVPPDAWRSGSVGGSSPARALWRGPYPSRSGDRLLLLRPVSAEGSVLTTLLAIDRLIDTPRRILDLGFDVELSYRTTRRGRPETLLSTSSTPLGRPLLTEWNIGDSSWLAAVAPVRGWVDWTTVGAEIVISFVLATLLTAVFFELRHRPLAVQNELESQREKLWIARADLADALVRVNELEAQLHHHQLHDLLTGLPNRAAFLSSVARLLSRARLDPDYGMAVVVIDFDRLDAINETMGREIGERLLVAAARRADSALRPHDLIGLLEAKSLAVLLGDVGSEERASMVAERIHEVLSHHFEIDGERIYTPVSMGLAFTATGNVDPEDLLRDASAAVRSAAATGRGGLVRFRTEQREETASLLELEADLRRALRRHELRLFFQPIVSLADGGIAGFEGLLRWNHPREGSIPPGLFIRAAETSGLIVELDRWTLRHACACLDELRKTAGEGRPFYLSVNLSGRTFEEPDLVDYLRELVGVHEVPPGHLAIEVTERVFLAGDEVSSELFARLDAIGVPLLIDDFGTGYSSLAYLHRFPFDILKIDKSFILPLADAENESGLVEGVIRLAHDLGMKTVAEGVETTRHVEILQELGCEYGQGYLFSHPVPLDDTRRMLREARDRPVPNFEALKLA